MTPASEQVRRESVAVPEPEAPPPVHRMRVGPADDRFEREADVVAARVVDNLSTGAAFANVSSTRVQRMNAGPVSREGDSRVQRTPTRVQRIATPPIGPEGGEVDDSVQTDLDRTRGRGAALDPQVRRSMEGAFGSADFGKVRIHEGGDSADLNRRLGAQAFTVGNDIHLGANAPAPTSPDGQHLLAHELTHTMQQGSGAQRTIRRMPSMSDVRSRVSKKAKTGTKIFGKTIGGTTSYNDVLAAVQAYSDYIVKTPIASGTAPVMAQVAQINALLDRIVAASQTYLAKKDPDDEVASLCHDLIAKAALERPNLIDAARYWSQADVIGGLGNQKWFSQLPNDPARYKPRAKDTKGTAVTSSGASDKGQNKSVAKVSDSSGRSGFFAEDDPTGKYEGAEYGNPKFLLGEYGVHDQDIKLGNRSIAMSRLDQLLKGNVIARTERGLMGDKIGTFQVGAKGDQLGKLANAGADFSNDANLARLLSKLQLIDAIAGQIDRHADNYFVVRDSSGKVTGLTGIDLDMAWMPLPQDTSKRAMSVEKGSTINQERRDKKTDRVLVKKGDYADWFPGFSRFCDEEMAEEILKVQPDDLRLILGDLLDPGYVEAAVSRLLDLQALLRELKSDGKLLKPDEWSQHLGAIVTENHSYFAQAAGKSRE